MTNSDRIRAFVLVLTGLLDNSSTQSINHCAENPSTARLPPSLSLAPSANLLQGIIDLGRASGVCMGIELVDASLIERSMPKAIKSSGAVEVAVRSLLADVPEYCAEKRGRILSVRPCNRTHDTWLDFKLRRFSLPAGQLQLMSNDLYSWLSAEVNPKKPTFGHFRYGDPLNTVGPYDKANFSVRMLLDQFVSDSHGAMWITVRPYGRHSDSIEPDQFWFIPEYDNESLMLSVVPQVRWGFANAEK